MRTRSYLLIILYIVVGLNYGYTQSSRKPNVIFILGDDVGYDLLTVNGGQSYSTPNLDSMARNGMSFTHCESTPLCNPTRFMLLTGKQNYRNYSNWGYLSDTAKTIANMMQDAGYNTGFFGKLQLQCSPERMSNWGWNKYTIFEIIDDTVKNINRYKSPNLVDENGRVPDSITKNNYCDDILTTRISNFIDSNHDNPFFLYYSMSLVHYPFCPTPDDPQYAGWDADKGTSDTSFFPSMMKYTDKEVGKILNKLRMAGLDSNTIVFFSGDNGTPNEIYYYANGLRMKGEKTQTREGGTHVPLIAYMPGYIAPNSKNDDLVDFTDFFPTFAGLAQENSLNKYGVLDGVSFYNRLFTHPSDSIIHPKDSVRYYIFSHYNPQPGCKSVFRWVRDQRYKLYDTTEPTRYGKFYNVKADPEENKALQASKLTSSEIAKKTTFRKILDTSGTWPKGPILSNAAVVKVTSDSVTVSATITDPGASALIERGSTLSPSDTPFYRSNHLPDTSVALGTFSQTRNNLLPQKNYYYSLYAMNANPSNSTGYAFGTFTTLSKPPLSQPTKLTATAGACSVKLTWNKATFPTSGANRAGYLIFYSGKSIVLNQNANGKAPSNVTTDTKTRMVKLQTNLPTLPAVSTTISGLSPDTLYNFILVPFTYDGTNNLTYNYLTSGALTTTKQPISCSATFSAVSQSQVSSAPAVEITPNPSRYNFILKMNSALTNKLVRIRVSDVIGRIYLNTVISGSSNYSFGGDLTPGTFIVYLSAGNKNYEFKIIKE